VVRNGRRGEEGTKKEVGRGEGEQRRDEGSGKSAKAV
jgi:hypothetical protein